MAKVFVPHNDGRFDLSDARRFGDLEVIFSRELYPDDANERMPGVMTQAYGSLSAFNPDEDSLLLVGAPVYTAICSYVLGDLGKKPVRYLRFDRIEKGYYEIKLA